jgi:hypothetical protein
MRNLNAAEIIDVSGGSVSAKTVAIGVAVFIALGAVGEAAYIAGYIANDDGENCK